MTTVLVELSPAVYERLQQRAEQAGKSPEALSQELLEGAIGASAPPARESSAAPNPRASAEMSAPPKQRTTREILEAAGHLRPLGPTLERMIIPGVTLEEVHELTRGAGGPSGSDIIIEQRGPKE
jgi:hypothetical protein